MSFGALPAGADGGGAAGIGADAGGVATCEATGGVAGRGGVGCTTGDIGGVADGAAAGAGAADRTDADGGWTAAGDGGVAGLAGIEGAAGVCAWNPRGGVGDAGRAGAASPGRIAWLATGVRPPTPRIPGTAGGATAGPTGGVRITVARGGGAGVVRAPGDGAPLGDTPGATPAGDIGVAARFGDADGAALADPPGTAITPPHTEQRARTPSAGTFAGSIRKTDRHSPQVTFTRPPRQPCPAGPRPTTSSPAERPSDDQPCTAILTVSSRNSSFPSQVHSPARRWQSDGVRS